LKIGLGIIGLGCIGKFILDGALAHADFDVKCIFDIKTPDLALDAYQTVDIASSVDELLARADINVVYIGTPPVTHIDYCHRVLDAGKAIWCEKPLGINLLEATEFVDRIEAENGIGAVNLSLATSPVVAELFALVESVELDNNSAIEMQFKFSDWPRGWQAGASAWLSGQQQGGFLREVFSHFVFIHHRLIGKLDLIKSEIAYSSNTASESYVQADYLSKYIPVRMRGVVGTCAADQTEWTLYGKNKAIRYSNWDQIWIGNEQGWELYPTINKGSVVTQLDEVTKLMAGKTNKLATFREALEVQKMVENTIAKADVKYRELSGLTVPATLMEDD
jgi:predicted dehydrogenase